MLRLFIFISFILSLNPLIAANDKASLVETAPVISGSLISYQTFIGTLYYSETSIIAAQVSGLVLKVNFDTTDQIHKDQILVELDHEILDSRILAIEASLEELHLQLEKINKDLKRYTKLLKQKNVSQQQFDDIYYSKTALEQKHIALQAQHNVLNIERRQSLIRAPYAGLISKKHISRGEWVDQGGKIATLINPENVYALFDIPALFIKQINENKAIDIKINQKKYSGTIKGLIVQGDAKTRTLPLKIKLDSIDNSLFGGLEAEIKLPRKTHSNSIIIPRDAVIKRFGQDVIFTIEAGKANMIPVEVKLYQGSLVAVNAEELNTQMRVITKGNERIFPDQAVVEKVEK
ncbi:MAG: efflux RND transporter periplasmic adaptor subunit [gamma proteobacterium symbiont of Taylorina sp.]|nr:efflux RND transporter periplasmic adaptor subunit [gamma proteobacterium symbiont of Taylorina sp.]